MNKVDQAMLEFHAGMQARRDAEEWLAGFEAALASGDAARIGMLLHADCHWRDILAFTWHLSSAQGRDAVAARLAEGQARTRAHDFHLPAERRAPRRVKRLGIESVEAIYEFRTAEGRCAGVVRLAPDAEAGGAMRAWHLSTTLESLAGHEEKIGANRPTGAAYSRNFGGDNWADMRRKAAAYDDREPTVLVIGGAMANTFLAAQGIAVGRSLQEAEMHDTAREILAKAKAANCTVVLPKDAVTAREFAANPPTLTVGVDAVPADSMILDVGPQSVADLAARLGALKTLVWNGPLGAFETPPFDAATVALAKAVAAATQSGRLTSVAGGGDTVSALHHAGVAEQMTYVSSAGGAFLEWLEGKTLPGVAALES
ncbi:MAG: phosphoglycerate kinase [Proteobacteria bacterium]|nr:phosphoglycerate kinase [Pseudomonadota bacterium]